MPGLAGAAAAAGPSIGPGVEPRGARRALRKVARAVVRPSAATESAGWPGAERGYPLAAPAPAAAAPDEPTPAEDAQVPGSSSPAKSAADTRRSRWRRRKSAKAASGDAPASEETPAEAFAAQSTPHRPAGPSAATEAAVTDGAAERTEEVGRTSESGPDLAGAVPPDTAMNASAIRALRSVLRVRPFRRIWYTTALSSLGDWLGLLATTALATTLAGTYKGQNYALGVVLLVRLLPSIILGPLAGLFADRFDRRRTMVSSDLLRFLFFVAIPIGMNFDLTKHQKLLVLYVASFLVECVSLFWNPAKDASVPNLVRKDQVEAANQLGLITTYGLTPVGASILFAGLDIVSRRLAHHYGWFHSNQVSLSLYFNALTFVVAAVLVWSVREISGHGANRGPSQDSMVRLLGEGVHYLRHSRLMRGIIVGIIGAFAAGGTVIGAGKTYVTSLGGGNAAYGVLFGSVFVGLGLGMAVGPKVAREVSRRRVFGVSILFAGVCLGVVALSPQVTIAVGLVIGVGFGAGLAFLSGMTLLGTDIRDEMRGRVFAFIQSLVRIVLILSLAAVPFIVASVGQSRLSIFGTRVVVDGTRIVLLGGAVVAMLAGLVAFRLMDDRGAVPVVADLMTSLRRDTSARRRLVTGGVLIAFEGGEGAGKSTQIRMLAEALRNDGLTVTETFEPGATEVGARIRSMLLNPAYSLDDRAEALLFAADRADHVATVIRPALDRGDIVLTDRFTDSSAAYQGAGRSLTEEDVRRVSRWATGGVVPDLTIVLDLPPEDGLARVGGRGSSDRLESESLEFHERVREAFRNYAEADPRRYLLVDAMQPAEVICQQVKAVVDELLGTRGPSAAQVGG
jgi:dTMP kinase